MAMCLHGRNIRRSYETVLILWIETSVLLHLSSCQKITFTLLEGKYACPGREIIFTCKTNGSLVTTWSSDEYIGRNGRQLEFIASNSIGHVVTSVVNPNTFAELTMKEGVLVTESQLHITVLQDIAIANITCSDVSGGLSSSVQFELLSLLDMPQDVSAIKVTPPLEDSCIVVVNWNPPSNANTSLVKKYVVESPSRNLTTTVTIDSVVYECGMESSHQVRIHAIDSCDRSGASSDSTIAELLQVTRSVSTSQSSATEEQGQQNSCAAATVGGVLGGFIGLTVLIAIALGIALGVASKKTVGHLKKDELEQVLLGQQAIAHTKRIETDGETEELKKKLYIVKSKHIREISKRPLLLNAPDHDEYTTGV